jgi:hypothetical protein
MRRPAAFPIRCALKTTGAQYANRKGNDSAANVPNGPINARIAETQNSTNQMGAFFTGNQIFE